MKWVLAVLMLGGVTIGFTQPVTRLWLKTTARAGTDTYDDLAVDAQRNVYVCGTSINTTSTKYEIVVVKYDKNGVKLWERFIAATSGHAVSRAITIDPNGHPIVAGQTDWNPPADGKSRVIKLAAASGAILYDTIGPAESTWFDVGSTLSHLGPADQMAMLLWYRHVLEERARGGDDDDQGNRETHRGDSTGNRSNPGVVRAVASP